MVRHSVASVPRQGRPGVVSRPAQIGLALQPTRRRAVAHSSDAERTRPNKGSSSPHGRQPKGMHSAAQGAYKHTGLFFIFIF